MRYILNAAVTLNQVDIHLFKKILFFRQNRIRLRQKLLHHLRGARSGRINRNHKLLQPIHLAVFQRLNQWNIAVMFHPIAVINIVKARLIQLEFFTQHRKLPQELPVISPALFRNFQRLLKASAPAACRCTTRPAASISGFFSDFLPFSANFRLPFFRNLPQTVIIEAKSRLHLPK